MNGYTVNDWEDFETLVNAGVLQQHQSSAFSFDVIEEALGILQQRHPSFFLAEWESHPYSPCILLSAGTLIFGLPCCIYCIVDTFVKISKKNWKKLVNESVLFKGRIGKTSAALKINVWDFEDFILTCPTNFSLLQPEYNIDLVNIYSPGPHFPYPENDQVDPWEFSSYQEFRELIALGIWQREYYNTTQYETQLHQSLKTVFVARERIRKVGFCLSSVGEVCCNGGICCALPCCCLGYWIARKTSYFEATCDFQDSKQYYCWIDHKTPFVKFAQKRHGATWFEAFYTPGPKWSYSYKPRSSTKKKYGITRQRE